MKSEAEKRQHREQKRKWREEKAAKVASARAEQAKHSHDGQPLADADELRKLRPIVDKLARQFGIEK